MCLRSSNALEGVWLRVLDAAPPQDPPRDDQPLGRGTGPAQSRHPGLSLPPLKKISVSHVLDGLVDRTSSKKPEKPWRHAPVAASAGHEDLLYSSSALRLSMGRMAISEFRGLCCCTFLVRDGFHAQSCEGHATISDAR